MRRNKFLLTLLALLVALAMMPYAAFAADDAVIQISVDQELASHFTNAAGNETKVFEFTVPETGSYNFESTFVAAVFDKLMKDDAVLFEISNVEKKIGDTYVQAKGVFINYGCREEGETTISTDGLHIEGSYILPQGVTYRFTIKTRAGFKPDNYMLKKHPYAKGTIRTDGNGKISAPDVFVNGSDMGEIQFELGDMATESFYVFPNAGYVFDGIYCDGKKLELADVTPPTTMSCYLFKDAAGNVKRFSDYWSQGSDIYFADDFYFSQEDGEDLNREDEGKKIARFTKEAFEKLHLSSSISNDDREGESWITLDEVKTQLGASVAEVKTKLTAYHIALFSNEDLGLQGENKQLTVRFKSQNSGSSGGSGGSYSPSPTVPTTPSAGTTVDKVTNSDGSVTTTTTETNPAAGTETKTEVTEGRDGLVSHTEITTETKVAQNGNDTAAEVSKESAANALEEAKKSEEKAALAGAAQSTTVITFTMQDTSGSTGKLELSLPTEFVKRVVEETSSEVKISTPLGEIRFDQKSLEEASKIGTESASVKISIESVPAEKLSAKVLEAIGSEAKVLDFTLTAGGTTLHNFGNGKAYIVLDIPEAMNPDNTETVYIKDNGFVEKVKSQLLRIDGKIKCQITAEHFSYYALVDKAKAQQAVKKTNDLITKGVKQTKILNLKAKASSGKIKLTWKKSNSGYKVDGYQIAKSTKKNTGYKILKTKTQKTFRSSSGLKKGQTYWYKVRAYRIVDDQKVYTNWAKVRVKAK